MKSIRSLLTVFALISLCTASGLAQSYEKPPKEILDILDAPAFPRASVSPSKDKVALFTPVTYPPISDLAQPMLRLAGLRINPNSNSRSTQDYYLGIELINLPSGDKQMVELPSNVKIVSPEWSADGKHIAFGNITDTKVELWIVETATGKARVIKDIAVNTALGGFKWLPDQRSLIVNAVPTNRGPAPKVSAVPKSPSIQETAGKPAAIRTYQDLLKSPADEALFEYYATSQPTVVSLDGSNNPIGESAIYRSINASPNGQFWLVEKVKKPFSYQFPVWSFGRNVEIWTRDGNIVITYVKIPLQDSLPEGGVQVGPRSIDWIPTEDATLMWAEALDGGDPKNKVPFRDKLLMESAPFNGAVREILKSEQRYEGVIFGEQDAEMWFYEYDRDTRTVRIFETSYRDASTSKLISSRNVRDRYNDIGSPEMKTLPNGGSVMMKAEAGTLLTGRGATPEGDRPFLQILDDKGKLFPLFRSDDAHFESVEGVISTGGPIFYITRRESSTEPPNLFLKSSCKPLVKCRPAVPKQLTNFKDPTPELRGITKQLVKYKRKDGVDLSFTLYLPPNYKEGTKLPALLWAYPLEYTDTATAGQVSGSTNRFTTIGGYSHLFLLMQGYAILNDATVPIVGDPLTVNDTFIEQLVDGAQAAVDKAAEMGVVDPDRVAVGGHSYGAFMTAHLLANSDIFRAGIARSGAYNRTLTPFGFQSERRALWEAPESYYKLSPFMRANLIKEPMLMIHGQADNNSGTYPMQSERMFAAIRGNGGTARLVMLPFESHGYRGRESIEHVLWEQIRWMDKYVKNAEPRAKP
ncbi:MAG: prolyl oligopeptidase family serine peptidase [Acidobacteriota bacterium]|nr:prolyl oligopeptidase family serine peptidase [Acidobacteriota bacterium]MDH3529629.1 prolyl oligopeptidase family serine peptidase [Acidobacteriota bacterium]